MLRLTEYIKETLKGKESRRSGGTVLIWNLTNRCNLRCQHCYASADNLREGELELNDFRRLIPQLKEEGVRFAILSGGEPLLKEELFDIARQLRRNGIGTYLSSNGTMINRENIGKIKENFNYVGISIDGEPEIHDLFRGRKNVFSESLQAIRLCLEEGLKTGIRFTITPSTYRSLPFIFELSEKEQIPKIYLSHLVYSGRGGGLTDLKKDDYREVVRLIMEKAFEYVEKGTPIDVVTGNNDADAVFLFSEFKRRYPHLADSLYEKLRLWGGNQAGVRLINITYRGDVKPDPFFSLILGNVKDKDFKDIWNSNGILTDLRRRPRRLKGRCGACRFIEICNGNSRARAYAVYGDYSQEDPACYIQSTD